MDNPSKRYLVLSLDYEVFGNGTGDVRQHVVNPTQRMAEVCSDFGVPLTVFFEAEEYLAFERNAKVLERHLGYNPAQLMRNQIRELAEQGHDVQLHLHPEWCDARWEQGRWHLTEKRTVDDLFDSQDEVTRYIAARKAVIEELTGHKVQAYRAGAFSAQPGRKLLTALAETGIRIDSSVVKGLTRLRTEDSGRQPGANVQGREVRGASPGFVFDYREAPSAKGPWRVREDVALHDPTGPVWEFPIYSIMGRRFQQLSLQRLRAKFSRNVPKNHQQQMVKQLGLRGNNPLGFLKFLWQPVPIKLDFHNLSAAKLLQWIQEAPKPTQDGPDILVLIGHSKEHVDDKSFARLLGGILDQPALEVISFAQVAKLITTSATVHNRAQLPGLQLEPARIG